ncbi:MAG: SDR family NAD(P)-dependent oxidoreductase [Thermaerobacter sp.]|nr:SDR family NAD(P)-dependent oxidoreductase [Thermaerobacter sp.]
MPETGRFTGKVAVVTGASRGIGRAVALRLARDGARVVVNHPDEATFAEQVVQAIRDNGGDAIAISADVSNAAQVHALFDEALSYYQRLDILVNNAGICPFVDWFEMTEDIWRRVQDVNLNGTFFCSQEASRIMRDQGQGGRIISMSSISALVGGSFQTHYTPTKAGIRSLMQSLAIVLGPYGITCNSVLPGSILTDINRAYYENPDQLEKDSQRIPMGRLGKPDDIAGVVAFLASDDAAYVNGADILVDGGLFVNLQ